MNDANFHNAEAPHERWVASAGMVLVAFAFWKQMALLVGSGIVPHSGFAALLCVCLGLASFVVFTLALVRRSTPSLGLYLLAFFVLSATFGYVDTYRKAMSPYLGTTDAHIYMDVAARLLLSGRNPYAHSLLDGFNLYRVPLAYSTPLQYGDLSTRLAYPSLSVLVLVPAILAGVSTHWVYVIAFVAASALALWSTPWWGRGLVFAVFFLDDTLLGFCFSGVTDAVWMLFLVLAVVYWYRKPTMAALCVGLACAYKQHPWFLVPLLLMRIQAESGTRSLAKRPLLQFAGVVLTVVLVLNLPFFLAGPRVFLQGVLEPLSSPMLQLSDGLTMLSMVGHVPIPRPVSSMMFWSCYGFLLLAYWRHFDLLRECCWIFPAIALFFGYRALTSYWYFYGVVALIALMAHHKRKHLEPVASYKPQTTLRIMAAMAVGFVATLAACMLRPAPFSLALIDTIDVWDSRVVRLRVRLQNKGQEDVTPVFALQSTALQPLPWSIESGPVHLGPGQSADYVLRAQKPYHEFEVWAGARLSVSDHGNAGTRFAIDIDPIASVHFLDAIPDEAFRTRNLRTETPLGWSVHHSPKIRVQFGLSQPGILRFTLDASAKVQADRLPSAEALNSHVENFLFTDDQNLGLVRTTIPLPSTILQWQVRLPTGFNVTESSGQLYGLRVSVFGKTLMLLPGDADRSGVLPSGMSFKMIRAPRDQWVTLPIDLRALLTEAGAPLTAIRFEYLRFRDFDGWTTPVDLGFFASLSAESATSVEFGSLSGAPLRQTPSTYPLGSEGAKFAWQAGLNLEMREFNHAVALAKRGTELDPNPNSFLLLGDAHLLSGQPKLAADAYLRSIQMQETPGALKGMGTALIALERYGEAASFLEKAATAYLKVEGPALRPNYTDALRSLCNAYAASGECSKAAHTWVLFQQEGSRRAPPDLRNCPQP